MLGLKTKQELARDAHILANGFNLVRYRGVTYLPVHFDTREAEPAPDPMETVWHPLSRDDLRDMAAVQHSTLFANDSELRSFDFMVSQNALQCREPATSLLVRTKKGLRMLDDQGKLVDPTGEFHPNALSPLLNEDKKTKAMIFGIIEEWVGSREDAESLLFHLATSLAPGYSAIKYVLLLGGGRNGKSTLMKMMHALFGRDNISAVTRQNMADQSPVVTDLNGKLLNLIFDGQAEYLKDSGAEKSAVAGEPFPIRLLYESSATTVQTNALFVEGLNDEPKSRDKSTALQKRLVRFQFGNTYPEDLKFARTMSSPEIVGAFLSLLIDHYVREDEVAEKLKPTGKALELQLEHMFINSVALQFLKHVDESHTLGITSILGKPMPEIVAEFQSWRITENDISTWAEPDVVALFVPLLNTERKSERINGEPRKIRKAVSLKPEAAAFIESLKGTEDGGAHALELDQASVVED